MIAGVSHPGDPGGQARTERANRAIAVFKPDLENLARDLGAFRLLILEWPIEGDRDRHVPGLPPGYGTVPIYLQSQRWALGFPWGSARYIVSPSDDPGDTLMLHRRLVPLLDRLGNVFHRYVRTRDFPALDAKAGWGHWADAILELVPPDQRFTWDASGVRPLAGRLTERVVQCSVYEDIPMASLQAIEGLLASPTNEVGCDASPSTGAVLKAPEPPPVPRYAFLRAGDFWEITFEGRTIRLRHMVGLETIERLLARPGQAVPARVLLDRDSVPPSTAREDPREIADLKRQIEDLEELPLTEANVETCERLKAELFRRVDKHGRPRPVCDDGERDRKAVVKRIRSALARLAKEDEALAGHLDRALDVSYESVYRLDAAVPWILAPAGTKA